MLVAQDLRLGSFDNRHVLIYIWGLKYEIQVSAELTVSKNPEKNLFHGLPQAYPVISLGSCYVSKSPFLYEH